MTSTLDLFTRAPLRIAITGATSGLGLALLDACLSRGDRVAFVARDARRVARVAAARQGSHGIVGDVARKDDIHPLALQIGAALGGLDVLVNNASSLGPVPLAPLADTTCEDLEMALATNLLGPFRLTKALLGMLAAGARERSPVDRDALVSGDAGRFDGDDLPAPATTARAALVVNISSDAAVNPYAGWGAYAASKAALRHLSRVWDEELRPHRIGVLSFDPGDMDTPLHALAVPDADPASLRRPRDAALELLTLIDRALGRAAARP